jgi:hypothetical protein
MKTLLNFTAGIVLGAAMGAGAYLLLTQEREDGQVQTIKEAIHRAIEEGKRSAEERRKQLEQELGFPIQDEFQNAQATTPHIHEPGEKTIQA